MLRKVILSLALALCTAPAAIQAQPKERVSFPVFMRDCVAWSIPELDDRVSSAEVVADAAIQNCWIGGGSSAMTLYGIDKGFSPSQAADYWVEIRKVLREKAIIAVLKRRAAASKAKG
jgi:hypothetical protein